MNLCNVHVIWGGDLIEEVHTHKSERGNSHKSCQRRTPKSDCGLLQRLQHMTQNHRNISRPYSMKSIPVQISPDKIFKKLDSIAVSHYLKIFWLSLTNTLRRKSKQQSDDADVWIFVIVLLESSWSPNSTDLYFWYLFVIFVICQQTNTKDIAGQSAMTDRHFINLEERAIMDISRHWNKKTKSKNISFVF